MIIIVAILFVLGLAIGSFLGVLIDRLPQDETLGGRSHCDHCHKKLRSIDMIPVVSYIFLGGKTSCCGKPLSLYYPFIELFTGSVFVLTYLWLYKQSPFPPSFFMLFGYLGIVSSLTVILFADLKYHIIPDEMNITILLFAFLLQPNLQTTLSNSGAGLVLAGGLFVLFALTKGKGLGFGDVKFAFVMGFLLGLLPGFLALYIAFIVGGLLSSVLLITRRSGPKTKIAFGPFLIIGTVTMLFYGEKIINIFNDLFV